MMLADPLAILDLSLRGAATSLLLLLALLLLRTLRGSHVSIAGVLYVYGIVSYLICPPVVRLGGDAFVLPCVIGAVPAAVFFWLFARALFDDEFRLRPVHGLAVVLVIAVGLARRSYPALPQDLLGAAPDGVIAAVYASMSQLISLCFVFLALVQTQRGRQIDLVPARRRFRDVFVALSAAYIAIILIAEIFLEGRGPVPWLDMLNAIGILIFILVVLLYLARLRTDVFPRALTVNGASESVDPGLVESLTRLMQMGHAYRQEGLTIGSLAEQIGIPEHRLRVLINQELGHRNFNQFLNSYRVAEARQRLADPAEARLPVLTIAMDLGYRSLGPFNKAFKEITGLTPTEYRKARLGERTASPQEKPS